jgi:hypothetical protein
MRLDRPVRSNLDFAFVPARLKDVIGRLHAHQGFHLWAKRLFNSQRHVAGEIGLSIQKVGKGLTRYAQHLGSSGHSQVVRRDDFVAHYYAGVWRVS